MAVADRNLTPGTRLWARYKGAVYTAEVVGHADDRGYETVAYQLNDGREFQRPSAAGAAIIGPNRTCNGWAFWSVGEPSKAPTRASKSSPSGNGIHPVTKPTRQRSRKHEGPTSSPDDASLTHQGGHALPIIARRDDQFECGLAFPTRDEASQHIADAHS